MDALDSSAIMKKPFVLCESVSLQVMWMETCACEGAEPGQEDGQPCAFPAREETFQPPGDIPATRRHSSSTSQPLQRVGKAAQAHPATTTFYCFFISFCTLRRALMATRQENITFFLPLSNWHMPRPTTHAWESPCHCCGKCPCVGSCHHSSAQKHMSHKTTSQNPTALRKTHFRLSHRSNSGSWRAGKEGHPVAEKSGFSRTLWLLQLRKMLSIFWRSNRCHHDSGSNKITFNDSWCLKSTWFKNEKSKSKRYLPSRGHFTSENRVSISQPGPGKHWGLVKERGRREKE